MIDLNAIKVRLAAAIQYARPPDWIEGDGYSCANCGDGIRLRECAEYDPESTVCDPCAATLWDEGAKDIAALVAEVERLRAVLDGPPICSCGSDCR